MVYRGPYKVRVEEKDIPAIEHPNDAIVRVALGAICGSDLHLYHGMMPDTRVGMTFGHEFIGVVEDVGSSVRNLSRGDRVMVPFNIFCGTCWFCARGMYSNCHNVNPNATAVGGIYGYSHTCGGYDGGQAEYVRVPFADVGPTTIPDWMDDEDAVLLTGLLVDIAQHTPRWWIPGLLFAGLPVRTSSDWISSSTETSLPIILPTRSRGVMSVYSPTSFPLRSTVIRSAIAKTWSMKWDTNRIAMPWPRKDASTPSSLATSPGSKLDVGSSRMRTRASTSSARAIATSC
ncbi:alcohol dehydrogenase catalytic domain-containing protein, partial [Kibdelosporangium lantanae]